MLGCLQHALKRIRFARVNFLRIAENNLGRTIHSGKQAVAMQDGVDQINLPSTGNGEIQPRGPWIKMSEFTGEIFVETAMSGLTLSQSNENLFRFGRVIGPDPHAGGIALDVKAQQYLIF